MSIKQFVLLPVFLIFFLCVPLKVEAISSYECQREIEFTSSGTNIIGTVDKDSLPTCASISADGFGFEIPTLSDLMTFGIRIFFAIAGLVALFQMLAGAFAWIISGGEKDNITAARNRIQAAVVGMILIVAVLSVVWTLEQVVFKRRLCLGLTCPLIIPGLIDSSVEMYNDPWGNPVMQTRDAKCCVCPDQAGNRREAINSYLLQCDENGIGSVL